MSPAADAAAPRTRSPFCVAAFEKPMTAVFDEKCSDEDKKSTLAEVVVGDVRAVSRWCDRAFAHPDRITVDEKVATACAAKIAERATKLMLDKTKSLQAFRKLHELPACKGLIVGKQLAGAPCLDDAQCAAGLTCTGLTRDGKKEGTCRKRGQRGDPCDDDHYSLDLGPDHSECAAGLACVDDACVPLRGDGAACDRWPVCKSGNCAIMAGKDQGVCAARVASGAKCGDESDCRSGRCEKGKCQERLKAGAPCATYTDCLGVCDKRTQECVSFCGSE